MNNCVKRFIRLIVVFLASLSVYAAEPNLDSTAILHNLTVESRLSYEQYHMPDQIPAMGVMGLHGLVDFDQSFYGGMGLYSGVKGDSGGYFALALEGGIQHQLWHQWSIDGGARVGGGGGRHTPVGGGLYIEPYLGLKYDFGLFRAGSYYSYINFVSGRISSQQVGVELSLPFTFNYITASDIAPCVHFSDLAFPFARYLGSTENYLAGMLRTYLPNQGVTTTSNQLMESHFEFVGFEIGHYFTDRIFLFFNMAGAFHGHQNGYADELLGLGYRFPFNSVPLDAVVKLGAGSGGGGGVNTGGGFIYEPTLGLEYHVTPNLGIELNVGYVQAPQANFQGQEVSLLIKYYLSDAILGSASNSLSENIIQKNQSYLEPWRIRLLNQSYLKPYSETGVINPTMQLLGLDFDYYIAPCFYLTGQTAFAYVGEHTGGYFSGMLGLGGQSRPILNSHLSAFTEILGGTAGGAGLDIGQGALIEPVLGLNYRISDGWSVQGSVGRLIALQGQFRSTTINAGLAYKFWTIS